MNDLVTDAIARIEAARTAVELEAVRIEVLGRKGILAQLGKDIGRLSPEERVERGKFINSAKQQLESAWESRRNFFDREALAKKLDAEWVDLTVPAPGARPGSL